MTREGSGFFSRLTITRPVEPAMRRVKELLHQRETETDGGKFLKSYTQKKINKKDLFGIKEKRIDQSPCCASLDKEIQYYPSIRKKNFIYV